MYVCVWEQGSCQHDTEEHNILMQGDFCKIRTEEMVHHQFLTLTASQTPQQTLMAPSKTDTATTRIKYFILLIGTWGF